MLPIGLTCQITDPASSAGKYLPCIDTEVRLEHRESALVNTEHLHWILDREANIDRENKK
jgi:hypothetical protein